MSSSSSSLLSISTTSFTSAKINRIPFYPIPGLRSPHIQTILPLFFDSLGPTPPSETLFFHLHDGDALFSKISTPPNWTSDKKTIVLLHGMGGSDTSSYMVRISQKLYQRGYRTLRLNLRGAGDGLYYAHRPYNGGSSADILQALQTLKDQFPHSSISIVAFSLGGNIALKMLGELGDQASALIEKVIAVCPPVNLAETVKLLSRRSNRMYHHYYLKKLRQYGARWIGSDFINSLLDFDNLVTAPQWGYRDAFDYYTKCSCLYFLSKIRQQAHLIFAEDDPFVNFHPSLKLPLSSDVTFWLSKYGGHMGFWKWAGQEHGYCWLDSFIIQLVEDKI